MKKITGLTILLSISTKNAFAAISGSGLPWEAPLLQIAESLQGPVATSLAVIAIVLAAVSLMFFEMGRGIRWFVSAVLGFSIAAAAFSIMGMFGLTSALI
jgi:type IV secretion system protein VirB2